MDNGFFNRPIIARSQILVHRRRPGKRISALFRRRTSPEVHLRLWCKLPEVSTFSLSYALACYQICIVKCLYSYTDDLPEIVFKTTAQECKMSTSGWRACPYTPCRLFPTRRTSKFKKNFLSSIFKNTEHQIMAYKSTVEVVTFEMGLCLSC